MECKVKKVAQHIRLPERQTRGSVGFDIRASVDKTVDVSRFEVISTGICIKPPEGCYGQVLSRSGLIAQDSILVVGGTIDPDFTGEIKVVLLNMGNTPYAVKNGDRIAQVVFLKFQDLAITEVSSLSTEEDSSRKSGGFGSTGLQ